MKSKLAVFLLGLGAGIVATLLALALLSNYPMAERHVSRPTIIYDDTNAAARWERVNQPRAQ